MLGSRGITFKYVGEYNETLVSDLYGSLVACIDKRGEIFFEQTRLDVGDIKQISDYMGVHTCPECFRWCPVKVCDSCKNLRGNDGKF